MSRHEAVGASASRVPYRLRYTTGLGGPRKTATCAQTLSIPNASPPRAHFLLIRGSTGSIPARAARVTFTPGSPFGYEAHSASLGGPQILGFHSESKKVWTLGYLAVYKYSHPGRKGKEGGEETAEGTSRRLHDPSVPDTTVHPSGHSDTTRAKKLGTGGGRPARCSDRKDETTDSGIPDLPPGSVTPGPLSASPGQGRADSPLQGVRSSVYLGHPNSHHEHPA